MRYAIITDIHANREALEAVLRSIATIEADKIVCLGDIVGYNADPAFCLETARDVSHAVVRGNHDKAVSDLTHARYFNAYAAEAVRWTRRTLTRDSLAYLRRLSTGPLDVGDGILLCHGSPQDEDLYLVTEEAVDDAFDFLDEWYPHVRICFFGHTHVPSAIDNQRNLLNTEGAVFLEKDRSYLINPGSVGQPRDNNPDAAFGVWDDEDGVFTFYRVPYAVRATQEKILHANLPQVLADRLAMGR